jgi:competence protein ComEC
MNSFTFHKYPAFRFAALIAAGIIVGKTLTVPFSFLVALTGAIFFVSIILYYFSSRLERHTYLLTISLVTLSLMIGATKLARDAQRSFQEAAVGFEKSVVMIGRVADLPVNRDNRTRFVFETDRMVDGSGVKDFSYAVLVTVLRTRKDTNEVDFRYGQVMALRGILSRPSTERNPGEFSPRQYYEANGISLFLFVRGLDQVVVSNEAGGWWFMRAIVFPARRFMLDLIDRTTGGEEGEFLKGLLIGERSGISASTRQAFTNSGVAHVLAVSGSNVAVVAAFLFFMLEFLRLPKWARVVAACVGLLFYMLVTGSQPPVVRATVMVLVFLLGSLAQEKPNAYNSLGVAALIILAMDARQLFDVGFQLSFMAVLSIMYMYPKANAWINRIEGRTLWHRSIVWTLRVCAVSLVAILGTLPLTAIYFGKVSIIGVLANIVVIPAVGLSVVLGFVSILAGTFSLWLADVYAAVNQLVLQGTLFVAKVAGGLSFAFIDTMRFTAIDAIPFYVALALLTQIGNTSVIRKLLIVLLLTFNLDAFFPSPPLYAKSVQKLRVNVIDVGQGDAVLVEFPDGKTMLVDAGPRTMSYDAGERSVVPFLKRRNISTIDLLVVSHPHSDHIGGAPAVLEQCDVKRVIDSGQPIRSEIYSTYLRDVRGERCAFESAHVGTAIDESPNVRLYVLSPAPGYVDVDTTHPPGNLNNTSVVVKLQYGDISMLLSGDAEKEAEDDMVAVYGDFLRSTLLKVGHHGSSTSSTQMFLDEVRPDFAVISVGKNNKFHHPSPTVIQRYEEMGVHISRTDEEGAIIFETDGRTLSRVDWR